VKYIQSKVILSPKRLCLLFTLLSILGGGLSAANAAAKQCSTDGGVSCCATIWIGSTGDCCAAYVCSNNTSGGGCSACNNAMLIEPQSQESGIIELAGIEHIMVNNTVLELQWS